jgi:hypothetical protein
LRGTELQSLSDSYKSIEKNIEVLRLSIEKKKEVLQDAKRARDKAVRRLREMQATIDLDSKINEVNI